MENSRRFRIFRNTTEETSPHLLPLMKLKEKKNRLQEKAILITIKPETYRLEPKKVVGYHTFKGKLVFALIQVFVVEQFVVLILL